MTHELRNLQITKIALVRKGFRPVNDGARITIVKAEEAPMSDTAKDEASVLERISKALAGLLKGDADVSKAAPKVSNDDLCISPDGSHGPVDGTHSHSHTSHYAVMMHDHAHEHDGDGGHYHDHVVKADAEHPALADGWKEVTADELRAMLGATASAAAATVEKAQPSEELSKLVADFTAGIQALTARTDTIEKAIPSDEHLGELIDAQLKPLAKAFEDFAVAFNRQPRTPNVTTDIRPGAASANGTADPAAVKDMDFATATRYLLHGKQ